MAMFRSTLLVSMFAMAAILAIGLSADAGDDRQGVPDPLLFSTFVGGGAADWPHASVVGPNGTVYITGYTLSYDFPTTEGAYQRVTKGNEEVYVLRLSADGSELLWATLIGGDGQDIAWDMALGTDGRVYVTGQTWSSDFPTTPGAYLHTREGDSDAFVLCLAPDGGSLVYSTLLGGEDDDKGSAIEVMADGRAVVAGSTGSMFFPTTSGAYDRALGGVEDVFVARLTADGKSLQASTYLGGSNTELEPAMVLDMSSRVWITGSTTSEDFPTTAGLPNDWSFARDVFVTSLGSDLASIRSSTVVGQIGSDVPRSIDIGPGGEVMVAGYTHSPEFPDTGSVPGNDNNGEWDGFIMVYKSNLQSREHQWLYGGSNRDVVRAAKFDHKGLIHVTGYTNSTNFPTTLGSYKPYRSGDNHDAFYMQVDPGDGYATINSTYIGKSMGDFGMDLDFDRWSIPIIVGHSRSPDFPTAGDPYDDTHDGGGDIVAIKYTTDEEPPVFTNDMTPPQVETGKNITFSIDVMDGTGVSEVWIEYSEGRMDYERPNQVQLEGDGTYTVTVQISTVVNSLRYHFWAWDALGHFSESEERTVTVIDTVPPGLVTDSTPEEGTTGDPLKFMLHVRDNWQVGAAFVEYSIGSRQVNASMDPDYSFGGINEHWNLTVHLADDALDPVLYRYHFWDRSGNAVSTGWKNVPVRDDDAPTVGGLGLPPVAQPDTWLAITVSIGDNIGAVAVWLEHFVDAGQVNMISVDGPYGPRVEMEVHIPAGRGDLHVTLHVEDEAGNVGTASGVLPFHDDEPPELWIVYENTTTTGGRFILTWTASDPAGVESMWGYYGFGYGLSLEDHTYFLAEDVPVAEAEFQIPEDSTQPLSIILAARDIYSNFDQTEPILIDVIDDDPPVAEAGQDQVLIQGRGDGLITLDASGSTDNVGIIRYVWVIDPGTSGERLEETSEPIIHIDIARIGRYQIDLRVYDEAGNMDSDSTFVTIKVANGGDGMNLYPIVVIVPIVVIAIAVVFLILFRRSRSRRP
jgi:hypothetical protein